MLRLSRILKNYNETGSLSELINLYGFIGPHVFLTKSGEVGIILEVRGVDYECLDDASIDGLTKRLESALKLFDENYRVYQYLFKRNNENIPYKLYANPIVDTAIKNRIAYLVDIIPSPPDSVEWPTLYIRGSHGLENVVTRVRERTDNQLQYLGEWHSHPDAYGTEPSGDDKRVFGWLAEHTARDSNPPVMIIAGQKDIRIFVSSIDSWVLLKYGSKRK